MTDITALDHADVDDHIAEQQRRDALIDVLALGLFGNRLDA